MMRTILPALLVALIGFLGAGCKATEEWVKPGVSDAQRDRDMSECLIASADTVPTAQGPQRRLNQSRYRRCMSDRGYAVKKAGE